MGDENIRDNKIVRMQKPIKNVEKIILMRSLLRDGISRKEAE